MEENKHNTGSPYVPEDRFYSIREVMERTELPASTLRYWESQFSQLSPRKDGHGNRYYQLSDVELIGRIKYIRDELKITRIEAIRHELETDNKQSDNKQRATAILERLRQDLIDLRSMI